MRVEKSDAVWTVIRQGLRQSFLPDRSPDTTVFIDQWKFDQTGVSLEEMAEVMDELEASGRLVRHALYTVGGDCWRIEVNANCQDVGGVSSRTSQLPRQPR